METKEEYITSTTYGTATYDSDGNIISSDLGKEEGKGTNLQYNDDEECKVYPVWNMHSLDGICELSGYAIDATYIYGSNTKLDAEILKRSLSLTLKTYKVFSGRMNKMNKRQIVLNDKGVLFIVAHESGTTVNDIIEKENEIEKNRFVDYSKSTNALHNGTEPLMRVKLTYLKDGCALGVWATHGVCDGTTYYYFMHNWSKVCENMILDGKNNNPFIPDICMDQTRLPYDNYARRPRHIVEKVLKKLNFSKFPILCSSSLI